MDLREKLSRRHRKKREETNVLGSNRRDPRSEDENPRDQNTSNHVPAYRDKYRCYQRSRSEVTYNRHTKRESHEYIRGFDKGFGGEIRGPGREVTDLRDQSKQRSSKIQK